MTAQHYSFPTDRHAARRTAPDHGQGDPPRAGTAPDGPSGEVIPFPGPRRGAAPPRPEAPPRRRIGGRTIPAVLLLLALALAGLLA